jgi:hypothetical protein
MTPWLRLVAIVAVAALVWLWFEFGWVRNRSAPPGKRWPRLVAIVVMAALAWFWYECGWVRNQGAPPDEIEWTWRRPDLFWIVCAVAVTASAIAWRWRTGNDPLPGHCSKCGYDLTGNVSRICSECGTPVAPDRGGGGSTGAC